MANPFGTNYEPAQPSHGSSAFNGSVNGKSESIEWTAEEQSILERELDKFAPEFSQSESNVIWYAKIAAPLHSKTVRDVALRCRWMTKKENSKRRKEDHNLTRRSKDRREKDTEPSVKSYHVAARPVLPPNAQQMVITDCDGGILHKATGGPTGQLLEQNARCFDQISANFTTHQIRENINLFCQARDNIFRILSNLSDAPDDRMKKMPPLPVKVNEELANYILPRTSRSMRS